MTATPTAGDWWGRLSATALIGTARREPPSPPADLPERQDAPAEVRLLDGAALAGAMRRAGAVPATSEPPAPAPEDGRPAAPDRAVQLLHLLLTQPPVRAPLRPLVLSHWLRSCAEAGARVPEMALPDLLDAATAQALLRSHALPVLGARGPWLAAANPAWDWVEEEPHEAAAAPPDDWAHLSRDERADWVGRLRRTDPDAARALVESTWSTDSARDRDLLLGMLETGLGPADEDLLERALDDRARSVRTTAQRLLDRLPGSARGTRMARRLAPLLSVSGMLRRRLEVALPPDPDEAAVRDGLDAPPPGRSRRGHHLERLAAAAPLDVWTRATGKDPADTVRMIEDEDVLRGLVRAVRARRDPVWAEALVHGADGPSLLPYLDAERRHQVAAELVADRPMGEVLRVVVHTPGPWSPQLSRQVVARLRRQRERVADDGLTTVLAERLDPSVLPEVRSWAQSDHAWSHLPDDLVQTLSLVPAIAEAFR